VTDQPDALTNALQCHDDLQSAAGHKYDELRAQTKEWADIAYEMWALLCNSTHDGHGSPDAPQQWAAARDRLRDRFHSALSTLPEPASAEGPAQPEPAR
jgi:hypothetical protein